MRAPLLGILVLFAPALFAQNAPPGDWATPAEQSNYRTTPDYADTMAYLRRIAAARPQRVRIEPFGKTGEGRELDIVIASKDGIFDPEKLHAAKRPIVLVQNAIHAGEMDGKDSCLALLRDMVITGKEAALLDRAVFVFIPIYNADGHERRSAYNRINQNGPAEIGWRANATNLNLNRDYMKADAPETRAFLAMFHRWLPDFFVDDHVTDGADFQYDVTFTIEHFPTLHVETGQWLADSVIPDLEHQVDASGHLASPTYISLVDDVDPSKGLAFDAYVPRFSTSYVNLENRPAMLVEMHMLKDYKTRVTGNYELLRALLQAINRDADKLIALNAAADREAEQLGAHPLSNVGYPLELTWSGETTPFLFRGYKYTRELSAVSGTMWIQYSHEPWNVTLPQQTGAKVAISAVPPAAYIIPPEWTQVIDVLAAHQVVMHRTTAAWTAPVETYRCSGGNWQQPPFEGHHPMFTGEGSSGHPGEPPNCTLVTETMTFPANSAVVELNQRLSHVAMAWLEPEAPDSAMAWNAFDPIFEQKEYGESHVLEKLAREMMAKDPRLKTEFEERVENDPKFAASPRARLEFFYEHSPWADPQLGLYPVGRLTKLDDVPLH
jgi:murein tripeptide amidase MpaA